MAISVQKTDNWAGRATGMMCKRCIAFVRKGQTSVGRCRRHAPTTSGWPVVYDADWCLDFRLDEDHGANSAAAPTEG